MESHQHKMDWAETWADLLAEQDEEGYVDVLAVDRRVVVEVMLGVGGPTRFVRFHLSEGEPYRAEYVDTWAVPDEVTLTEGEMWDAWSMFGGEALADEV